MSIDNNLRPPEEETGWTEIALLGIALGVLLYGAHSCARAIEEITKKNNLPAKPEMSSNASSIKPNKSLSDMISPTYQSSYSKSY